MKADHKYKVGDYVKWNHTHEPDFGFVVNTNSRRRSDLHIVWTVNPQFSGWYDSGHSHMELISESR